MPMHESLSWHLITLNQIQIVFQAGWQHLSKKYSGRIPDRGLDKMERSGERDTYNFKN